MPRWAKGLIVAVAVVVVLGITGAAFLSTRQQPTGGDVLPPPPTYSWHPVTSFSGPEDKTTDSFHIAGSKFRLTWTVTEANCPYVPDICETYLQFRLFEEGTTSGFLKHVVIGPGYAALTGETTVEASGTFYLLVFSTVGVASWTIAVEEWR